MPVGWGGFGEAKLVSSFTSLKRILRAWDFPENSNGWFQNLGGGNSNIFLIK